MSKRLGRGSSNSSLGSYGNSPITYAGSSGQGGDFIFGIIALVILGIIVKFCGG